MIPITRLTYGPSVIDSSTISGSGVFMRTPKIVRRRLARLPGGESLDVIGLVLIRLID